MSTSDKRRMNGTVRMYAVPTASCAIFGLVYEQFGHDVLSPFARYLLPFLLLGGAIPFLLLYLLSSPRLPGTALCYVYHSGLAAFTVGSCLTDAFDTYRAAAPLAGAY